MRQRFLEMLKIFIWQKYFIGAGGMVITDEVRVVISACAVRLVLHLDLSYYDRLSEIVVYPYVYRHWMRRLQSSVRLEIGVRWSSLGLQFYKALPPQRAAMKQRLTNSLTCWIGRTGSSMVHPSYGLGQTIGRGQRL
jgi:hypothetical protein